MSRYPFAPRCLVWSECRFLLWRISCDILGAAGCARLKLWLELELELEHGTAGFGIEMALSDLGR